MQDEHDTISKNTCTYLYIRVLSSGFTPLTSAELLQRNLQPVTAADGSCGRTTCRRTLRHLPLCVLHAHHTCRHSPDAGRGEPAPPSRSRPDAAGTASVRNSHSREHSTITGMVAIQYVTAVPCMSGFTGMRQAATPGPALNCREHCNQEVLVNAVPTSITQQSAKD